MDSLLCSAALGSREHPELRINLLKGKILRFWGKFDDSRQYLEPLVARNFYHGFTTSLYTLNLISGGRYM